MLSVCKVLKAHGIRGEVKVECYTDTPDSLTKVKAFFAEGKEYKAERVKPFGNFALIKFAGIDDMNSAETLRNKEFFAKKSDLPKPPEGFYYIDDLLNCAVIDDVDERIGVVEDVLQYGAADVFVLRDNGKIITFPHLKVVIAKVDVASKTIIVKREEFDKVAVYED